ncbi:TIGR02302 family protein [Roseomonas marmotae]|uniref:TIGR02302 family protein n=1 Tax=Roseomonas marmotae TaxID=2768161 RepID=A0ABS3K985_9PROT|nr:TIGR02302 family protein [Roseomonas marmotae]MBO1074017.1 TIGR02302 family protein [Roseomonas marmotae]QTI78805.1 TIGR02302 family protein [Roseomonas marmotae]
MQAPRDPLSRRLSRGRRLAWLALAWEELWPRLWPVLGVAGLFAVLALSGVFLVLPGWLHLVLLALFIAALGWTAWKAIRGFALPQLPTADRRLERESGLPHRPLSTLTDRPATQDPVALALWQVHQARAVAALSRLRVGAPRPGLAARDRRGLRLGLLVALAAAVVVAGEETPERLRRAFQPALGAPVPVPALRLEAWISPPAYTGAAPVFLPPEGGALTVPAGSRLQVSLSGGRGGVPELRLGEEATPFRALDAASFAAEAPLESARRIVILRDGQELAQWSISTQIDLPPRIAFVEPPAAAARGLAIRLPWRAEDDWGVASARAEITLAARPDAPPLVLSLPIPGDARQPRGVAQPDLSAHPWAGLPVRVRLLARDNAGQEGQSEFAGLDLPERRFSHPVAQRLAALRKALSLDPLARRPAARGLDELSSRPDAFENDVTTFLALRSARHRLTRDRRPEAVDEVQGLMWQTAIALEEGRANRTARALAEARQALREALAEAERMPPDAERRAELEQRVQELREAIRQHLEALAEQLQRENGEAMPQDPQARMMDPRELDRRTQEMQEAAREGRTDDLQQELAELEQMLDALQNGQMARQGHGPTDRQRAQQRQRGEQQMSAIQDMVQREGEMLDRSNQREQAEGGQQQQQRNSPFRQQQRGQDQQPQGSESADGQQRAAEAQSDARQQRALRRALGELMQQFGDLTGEVPEALGRADQAMRQAQEALGGGGDATPHQQQAIRELQEGAQQMAQTMERQFGQGQQGQEGGEGQGEAGRGQGMDPGGQRGERRLGQRDGRDPLGRPTRTEPNANDTGSDTVVPGEAEALRTREIQEELRRRGADRERPPSELDYIDRLLKTF